MEYVEGLTFQDLAGEFTYLDTKGKEYSRERGMTLDHVFNQYAKPFPLFTQHSRTHHITLTTTRSGTHHRGQVSAGITQLAGGMYSHLQVR